VGQQEDKRAKIIEAQALRQRAAVSDGSAQANQKPRANWAATPALPRPRRRWNNTPPR
jgi:hypothetical protein